MYLFCIYHIGKEDVDACLISSAMKIGFVSKNNEDGFLFKPAKLPREDPDSDGLTAATVTETVTGTGAETCGVSCNENNGGNE